ncbi:MAG: hypothetical protein AB8G15_13130 [Saprospiraceae bacterium]
MKRSRLIRIFSALSGKERRELRKWLLSPSHNQREDVILLHDYLFNVIDTKDAAALDKKVAFPYLYPKETFDDAKMRQVIFFSLKVVEEFLIYQELRKDEVRSRIALARIYRDRKLDKSYQKAIKAAKTAHESFPYRNEAFLQNEYLLQQEDYTYIVSQNRAIPMNLQEVSDALDRSYLADRLRQSCHMLAHQKVYKTDYESGLIDKVLLHVEHENFMDNPAIATYYFGYKAIVERENVDFFNQLKVQITKYGHLFPQSEIKDIYLVAINYCIGRVNQGERSFFRDMFDLYKLGLEEQVFIESGIVSRYTFRNIVTTALVLKEFDWVEAFIIKYKVYLAEQYRESFVHFNLSKLHFERGDYDEAMKLLSQFEYKDILLNLNAKAMLIKMYYEQDEMDTLESLLESVRNYLQRKKIIAYHKSNYKNFIRFTKKLLKVNPYSEAQKAKLKKEIAAVSPLTEKAWLLKQL